LEFQYDTIKEKVENTLLKEKGSKFIGFAYPVANEEEVKKHLQKIYDEAPTLVFNTQKTEVRNTIQFIKVDRNDLLPQLMQRCMYSSSFIKKHLTERC